MARAKPWAREGQRSETPGCEMRALVAAPAALGSGGTVQITTGGPLPSIGKRTDEIDEMFDGAAAFHASANAPWYDAQVWLQEEEDDY